MSRTVEHVIEVIERFAPPEYALEGDPIGLCLGRRQKPVERVLTALDLSAGTVEAALKLKADLIVTHHPPIYTPISTITDDSPEGDLLLTLAEHNIALFSAHTNVDATVGGLADLMAEMLFPDNQSVTPLITLPAHEDDPPAGFGRVVFLPKLKAKTIFERSKKAFAAPFARLVGDADRDVSSCCVWPGSMGEQVVDTLQLRKIDLIVCGESKHHINLALHARGIMNIVAGHDSTENPFVEKVASVIRTAYPEMTVEGFLP